MPIVPVEVELQILARAAVRRAIEELLAAEHLCDEAGYGASFALHPLAEARRSAAMVAQALASEREPEREP